MSSTTTKTNKQQARAKEWGLEMVSDWEYSLCATTDNADRHMWIEDGSYYYVDIFERPHFVHREAQGQVNIQIRAFERKWSPAISMLIGIPFFSPNHYNCWLSAEEFCWEVKQCSDCEYTLSKSDFDSGKGRIMFDDLEEGKFRCGVCDDRVSDPMGMFPDDEE